MKKRFVSVIVFLFLYGLVGYIFLSPASAKEQGSTTKITSNDQSVYNVPEGKEQKWNSIRKLVRKEYGACAEHTGNDPAALKRCKKAYRARLDREHKRLLFEN